MQLYERKIKMTIKEKVLNAITKLPQNVDFEEILERLYFLYKVETGLQQVQSGDTLTHSPAMLPSGYEISAYDPEFVKKIEAARRGMKKYRNALIELAK